jgi:hypothetical protein
MTWLFTFVALAAVGAGGSAQAAGPGGTAVPRQGFSVPGLVAELSLFLPAEATRGMYGGFGGRGGDQGGGKPGPAGQQRPAFQFTRDPKLFLTHDQTAKMLPILSALRDDPMPTPSRARQVQADIDAILTPAQKAEYEQFRKALENLRQNFSRSGAQGQNGGAAQNRPAQNGGVPLTTLERRQRLLDAFITIMQDRMRESRKLARENLANSRERISQTRERAGRRMTPAGRIHRAG